MGMTITPDAERCARLLGAFLLLLCVAYWREWRKGGALLVVQLWLQEALYHLGRYVRAIQPPSEDWVSTRVQATARGTGRYWRARARRDRRLLRYLRTWTSKPEFQAAMKQSVRLISVRREASSR